MSHMVSRVTVVGTATALRVAACSRGPYRIRFAQQRDMKRLAPIAALFVVLSLPLKAPHAGAQSANKPFEPTSGQSGKDVVWVPTPPKLVEKMLNLANVTPADFVIDLGSGDGRNIIAAAQRGARALGIEYNPDMVNLSNAIAAKAGVAGKAQFVQGDMFEADISQATVLALFLLPENLDRLMHKFLELKPGTRIVLNTFGIDGWTADRSERVHGDCGDWCEALLYIVPAKVAGRWRLSEGVLTLKQQFQVITGSIESPGGHKTISGGRVDGDRIRFSVDGVGYTGRVSGDRIDGQSGAARAWSASREG